MSQATADMFTSPCLRLKGSMVPLTTLELLQFDPTRISRELEDKVRQAPKLFDKLPLVLSLEKFEGERDQVDFRLIKQLCMDLGTQLVGVRSDHPDDLKLADAAGLAVLQPSRQSKQTPAEHSSTETEPAHIEASPDARSPGSPSDTQTQQQGTAAQPAHSSHSDERPEHTNNRATAAASPKTEPAAGTANKDTTSISSQTKVVRTPVRSGQQIYVAGGDLILLAQVSAGAEVLADGNIHAYAPMRGRALAGVKGDTNAFFFCQSLEAELVSVAGQYKLSEDLQGEWWKQAVQINLQDEKLTIRAL